VAEIKQGNGKRVAVIGSGKEERGMSGALRLLIAFLALLMAVQDSNPEGLEYRMFSHQAG
jgi:hypothetical protein